MKRLVLEQWEKNKILEMYGLVTEEELDTELIEYANNYIDNTDCDQIYNDMTKALQAATAGQLPMSDEDKKELESNLKNLGLFKSVACKAVKQTMKTTFEVQSKQNPEKLKTLMCWFSVNVRPPANGQPLKSCTKSNNNNQITSTADTQVNNQVVVNPQATGDTQSSGSTQIDYNLDTVKKVQDFQTWMDKKGKWAWSERYKRWYDVRGRVNYGYGRLGPNTKKNWEKYKNDYLKEIGLITDKKEEVKKDQTQKNDVNKDQVKKNDTNLDLGSEQQKKDESNQNLGSEEQKISTTDF